MSLPENMTKNETDTMKGQYLTFAIAKETYGIEISYVTEIVGIQEITQMPEMPVHIKGIINLRGIIVPVMDVRLRFRMEPKDYDDRTCVIVVDFDGTSVGLIVDRVSEVLTLDDENIAALPQGSVGLNNRYVKNIGKIGGGVVLLLDCDKLLTDQDMQIIDEICSD